MAKRRQGSEGGLACSREPLPPGPKDPARAPPSRPRVRAAPPGLRRGGSPGAAHPAALPGGRLSSRRNRGPELPPRSPRGRSHGPAHLLRPRTLSRACCAGSTPGPRPAAGPGHRPGHGPRAPLPPPGRRHPAPAHRLQGRVARLARRHPGGAERVGLLPRGRLHGAPWRRLGRLEPGPRPPPGRPERGQPPPPGGPHLRPWRGPGGGGPRCGPGGGRRAGGA